jgi:hypothetical protein
MTRTALNRPGSIAEIARRAVAHTQGFDAAIREFLDEWQSMPEAGRIAALSEEPVLVGRIHDAYLAALGEHLALSARLDVPAWAEKPQRFLREPFFAGGLESLKAILLAESPLAFRRRLIFISADALSRPRREFIQDNALYAALDI